MNLKQWLIDVIKAFNSIFMDASHGPPALVAIDHDDDHAKYVGRMADGRQFFLATPFEPAIEGQAGREFLALYLFDGAGKLIEAKIAELGPRASLDDGRWMTLRDQWIRELSNVSFERIEIAPFSVERFGTTFGLIARPPEDEDDSWSVELIPGNYMVFSEPWDSGEYDT